MSNFTIMRNGLNTEIMGDPHIGQSSEDVTVTVTDDGTYSGYTKRLYYSYCYHNELHRALSAVNSNNEFIIPVQAFFEPGMVKLSVELSNGTNCPACNACFLIVTDGAKDVDTSILPSEKTWQSYIQSYIKSDVYALESRIDNANSRIDDAQNRIKTANSRIDNLIVSSGSDSSAEVIDARNGYDGTTYNTLGTAIRTQVKNLNDDIDKYCGVSKPTYTLKENTYINNQGYISQSGWVTSNPIPVNANDIVKLTAKGYLQNIVMINMCDENGNLSLTSDDRRWSIDSTRREYTFIIPRKGYVVVSGATSTLDLKILTDISNVVLKNGVESANNIIQESNLTPLSITKFKSGYITADGSVADNPSFVYSEPVKLYKGQIVKSLVRGYLNNVSLVSVYNEDGTYTPLVVSTDSNEKTLVYNIKSYGKYVFCTNANVAYDYKIYIDCATLLQPQETVNFMTIFHKLGVIGDSLSSGEIVRNNEYIDRYDFSWLSNIARRNGLKCEHYSQGGMTAKNWLNNTGSLYDKFQNDDELASAIFIALGTNDKNAGYQVGNSTDAPGTDSFCGYIKNIIETIRTKNPNCVIFMVSLYNLSDTSKIYSNAIRDLSKLYDLCYFVNYADNSDGVVTSSTDWSISRNGHFTTTSYVKVSVIIEKLCNDIVKNNQNVFGYFGLDND